MAEYGASNIKVLKGLEAVRKRPGMYIGDTSIKGLHHLVYEVVDNSIDEAMAGYCDTIKVTLTKSNSVIIEDNGRGIPVAQHPTEKISAATVVLTVLHAGGKFDKDTYKVSGGLHGVGVSVVNALSKKLHLTIFKNGNIYEQSFKKGIPQGILTVTGSTRKNGTKIEFWADDTIFTESVTFQKEILVKRFRELAYLNPKIKIDFRDERDGIKEIFHFEGGIKQFVEDMNRKEPLTTAQFFQGKADDIEIDIALMYCKSDTEKSLSFVNNIKTADGGTHEAGFRAGLTRSLARYISKNANAKERGVKITGEDCKEGLIAIVSVRVPEPQFEGQTKGKLGSSYVRPLVQKFFSENFNKYLEENPIEAKAIMSQVLLAARGRDAAKRAKDLVKRKDSMSVGTLPGKLADCQTKDANSAEIYLVEGDSAGGCHSGETKVKCANGKDIEIAILAEEHKKGKVNFIYTYNHKRNRIELQKIKNAWQTKITDDLIYITLDNGKRELCTSDHLYMLRDGTYKPAKDLKAGDSLMPLYMEEKIKIRELKSTEQEKIRIDDIVIQPNGKRDLVYHLADDWNIINNRYSKEIVGKFHRHHINRNTRDNSPTNIIRLSEQEHLNIHKEDFNKQTAEYKAYMSKKMKEQSDEISQRVIEDWKNPEYRAKFEGHHKRMRELQIKNGQMNTEHFAEYWANETHRREQSQRVTKYLQDNSDAIEHNRQKANEQWSSEELRRWRAEETRKQMSDPNNVKRKLATERETRIKNSLEFLNSVGIDNYEKQRRETKNRKIFTIKTLLSKMNESENYSNLSNEDELIYSDLYTYNHKVIKIEKYEGEPIPVYDIEVSNTHNFALSSGVFVHNSAKQGRDRVFQAILPLKGKILNVEKARLEKILKSDEIKNMITALGCGIGDEFNEDKLRYHKIIIMTDADVDGCLKGDTKVKLLDGTYKSMEELEKLYPSQKDKFWIWASDENGNAVPAEAHSVRVTKKVTKLYKIILDNDYTIEATDNHPFRLINGEYIRADELVEDMEFSDNRVLKSIEIIEVEETPVYDLTVDKYHNFAIKAGEDSSIFVHNSHIQTLLMTFFFRFLKPIIEKGYLYLAQPPLYRYKKGKNETYLKDDKALNDFLIENGIDILDSYSMGKKDLTELFKLVAYYKMTLLEIEKRFALSEVIRYMIENPDIIGVSNQELSIDLEKYINDLGYNILTKSVNDELIQYFVQTNDGLEELIVNETLFTSSYYNEAIYIYKKIEERLTDEFKDKDLLELLNKVEKSAKKGAYIQRYKGLGEMNPEQLWETTMNPEYRRLLKVVIDDDEIADDTFILFMGDEVEPRRAYIEKHAKDVKHLDV